MKKLILSVVAALCLATSAFAVDLNSRGQVTGCVAGGVAHIDGKVVAQPAGGCNWVDDDTIVYQVCDSTCIVQTYNQRTGEKKTVFNGGALEVTAGGGVWACFCGVGVQTSTGEIYNGSYVRMNQSGPNGEFAIKVAYQSSGPWDVVEKDGSRWRLTDGDATDITLLGNHRATWAGPSNNMGLNIKWLGGWWLRSAFIEGKLWVMYQNDKTGTLFLHPYDSFIGYVVSPDTLTYEPVLRVLPDGSVRAAWSTHPSELPTTTKVVTIDMRAPRIDLSALVTPTPPPPPPPGPPAPPTPPTPPAPPAGFPKDLTADLKAERAKYGALLNQAQAGELINAVAWKNRDLGFGLLRKDGGNNCPVSGLNVRVSCDWIVNKNTGTGCDALGSGPDPDNAGPSNPSWCSGEPFDTGRFVAPVAPTSGPVDPGPTPEDPQIAQLKKALADLKAQFDSVTAQVGQLQQRQGELEAERDDLKTQVAAQAAEIEALKAASADPCSKVKISVVPGWIGPFVGTRCSVK